MNLGFVYGKHWKRDAQHAPKVGGLGVCSPSFQGVGRAGWRSRKPVAPTQRWVMLAVAALLQEMWVYTSGT